MKSKLTYLFLIATLFLASCAKESIYTITNDTGMDGTVFVHECNAEGETITIQNATINDGSSKSFVANDNTVKLKLYIDELDIWVQQVFYLEGTSTQITINGKTVVGRQEP